MDRAGALKQRLKALWFGIRGKDPEAAVVSFCSGDEALAERMVAEIRSLVPDRRHIVIPRRPGSAWRIYRGLRRELRRVRIGLAPVLFTSQPDPLRLAAFLLAPRKILAYNSRLERHHLRLRTCIASWLFLRGVPLDRIFLRPWWLWPWKRDRSVVPSEVRVIEGRPLSAERRRVAVLAPYSPYPLSHGGAVRMFHLLREAAREFDIFLFAFAGGESEHHYRVLAEFCAQVVLAGKPRYREPRWSTLLPPEVREFHSPAMRRALDDARRRYGIELLQIEYTQLASYGGDILVEHDVTFDLFDQVRRRRRSLAARWDWYRWRRFELRAARRYRRVVTMSGKDALLLGAPKSVRVIENGVDLERLQPQREQPGRRLLFIGSFRHFPNIEAFRFFTEQVLPLLHGVSLTVVCGPDHLAYWNAFTDRPAPQSGPGLELLGFVADVRPLYLESNLVIVPTTVSAGTNIKVLEAMAMERAVVSTSSGCAGIGLEHRASAWIADDAAGFAEGVSYLLDHPEARARMARAARVLAERRYDWKALGRKQCALFRELLS